MNIITKTTLLASMIFTLFIPLTAYQSSSLDEEPETDGFVNCLAILHNEHVIADASESLWTETHCKKTADNIVGLFNELELIQQEGVHGSDLHNFGDTAMGKKLLNSCEQPEQHLFSINICGSGHVLVVEKRGGAQPTWRVFQSWQREFTLAQWLGMEQWKNPKFNQDFAAMGGGKEITREQLIKFLAGEVAACQDRLQQFRDYMLGVPWELAITSFRVKR